MIAVGLLLILGAGGWYLYESSKPMPTTEASLEVEGNFPDIARVSLADARAAYETRSAVFLDVRDASSYTQSHIPGALSIPLGDLPDRLGELDPEDWIIPY
jgi:3-mercaptopyruvate sulfurtransferase SseA